MTTVLSPSPFLQFLDPNGLPAARYKLFTYSAGTTTKIVTYVDSTGVGQNTNPIILDAYGQCNLWLQPNTGYKYVLAFPTDTDPPANPIRTTDNIIQSQLITLYGGVDTGIANAYVLNFTANFTSYIDGIVIYWTPANSNTGPGTININGLGVISIVNPNGSALTAGEITINQPATIFYKGGLFYLLYSGNPIFSAVTVTGSVPPSSGMYLPAAGSLGFIAGGSLFLQATGKDITARGVAICKFKTASLGRTNNTVLADPDLTYAIPGAGTYGFDIFVAMLNSYSGGGLTLGVHYSGALTNTASAVNAWGFLNAAFQGLALLVINTDQIWSAAGAGSGGHDTIHIQGNLTATGAGNLSLNWAQSTTNAAATTIAAGSYLKVTQLS